MCCLVQLHSLVRMLRPSNQVRASAVAASGRSRCRCGPVPVQMWAGPGADCDRHARRICRRFCTMSLRRCTWSSSTANGGAQVFAAAFPHLRRDRPTSAPGLAFALRAERSDARCGGWRPRGVLLRAGMASQRRRSPRSSLRRSSGRSRSPRPRSSTCRTSKCVRKQTRRKQTHKRSVAKPPATWHGHTRRKLDRAKPARRTGPTCSDCASHQSVAYSLPSGPRGARLRRGPPRSMVAESADAQVMTSALISEPSRFFGTDGFVREVRRPQFCAGTVVHLCQDRRASAPGPSCIYAGTVVHLCRDRRASAPGPSCICAGTV
jgi:hypothetical protein